MTDEQKQQIENVAKIILDGEIARERGEIDCSMFNWRECLTLGIQRLAGATALIKAGYQKLHGGNRGEIVELPCKIGDPVWVVCRDLHDYILIQGFCCGFHIDESGIRIITNVKCYDNDRMGNYTNKDEAKKRLAELNGGAE